MWVMAFPLIVMGCDERYALPLAVAMYSALRSTKSGLRVTILCDQITEPTKCKLAKAAARGKARAFDTIDVELKAFTQHNPGYSHLSAAMYSRLLIPSLLPAEPRCIWLDSDVLVQRDLNQLWETDLHGLPVGAVTCYYVPTVGEPHGIPYMKEAALAPTLPHFNSGIMLLDLDRWRAEATDQKVADFIQNYGSQMKGDQDLLNGVFLNRWHACPGYWNDQEALNRKSPAKNPEPNIRHFSGPLKPWNSGLLDADCRRWLKLAAQTGFYSPLEFARWRMNRLKTVLHNTGQNWLKARGF
jgi:lipopolysaccharide biosynthesis glycosyltransferase